MLIQRKAIVFLVLNITRILSIFAILSVFSTLIYMIVKDAGTYAALNQEGNLVDVIQSCEYLPSSNIPTTTFGIFWAQLNRSWDLIVCIVLLLSGE
jgi:hypothetical protein